MASVPTCPDPGGFAEGDIAQRLSERQRQTGASSVNKEEAPVSPEDEFQRRWRAQYDRVVPQAADLTYESCVLTVEETGEFPDFDWMFDAVTRAMRDARMMRGTEWMADTGFGFGYARALVECRGRCDVSEGVRAIAEYMGFDGEEELRELGIAV